MNNNEGLIRDVLLNWAENTRLDNKESILKNHDENVLIYDVLAPMLYQNAASYRASWDEWQPQTQGESIFKIQDLKITADTNVAFAHCLILCGGELQNGERFEDLVRGTFCFRLIESNWKIVHQHISKPLEM